MKKLFPIFKNNPGLIYLDNAATTQKPQTVIDRIKQFYEKENANVHRGLYPLSDKSTELYEEARVKVAEFINADPDEIIFTSGATDSINGIITALNLSGIINKDSNILLSESEHHSNVTPWQVISNNIDFASLGENFDLIIKNPNKYDVISLQHASNVTGRVYSIEGLFNTDQIKILDLSQTIGHTKIDVKTLDIDFGYFSAHKAYGPMGVGVLFGRKELLEKISPFKFGGGMIRKVEESHSEFTEGPQKFEAGTPNVAGTLAFASALDFILEVGFSKIEKHELDLRLNLIKRLKEISEIKIISPENSLDTLGIVSIHHPGVHAHDLAQYLGDSAICVRAGHHCAQILHSKLGINSSLRFSTAIYNDINDIEMAVSELKKAIAFFKK